MMLKNSFLTDMKENLKRRNWVFWIHFLTFFCYFPGFLLLTLNSVKKRMEYYDPVYILKNIQEGVMNLFQPNPVMVFLVILLGCLAGLQAFSYLHDKKQVNFYHSQPVRRNRRYLVLWFNGILIFAVTYLINMFLGMAVAGMYGAMNGTVIALAWKGMLAHFLLFLSGYHLSIIAVMLTGNMLVSMLAVGVLHGYELAVRGMYLFMASAFYETFNYRGNIINTWFSPFMTFMKYFDEMVDDTFLYGPSMSYGEMILKITVMVIVFGVIGWLLYGIRPSESHGKSISFPKIKEPLRVLLLLIIGTFCGMMIYAMSGSSVAFGVAGVIFFTILGHAVIQLIYEVDFRAVMKKLPSMGISVAVAVFCFLIFALDMFGYDNRMPKQSQVESIGLNIRLNLGSSLRVMPDGKEYGINTYSLYTMKLTDLDTVYELLEYRKTPSEFEKDDVMRSVEVAFRMKNGKTEYRHYHIDMEKSMEVLNQISQMEEYQIAMNQVLEDNFIKDYKIHEISYHNGEKEETLPQEQIPTFWEAYRKDIKENKFSDTYQQIPIGQLTFHGTGIQSKTYDNQWNVTIYPSYKNTIAILENENISPKWEMTEEERASKYDQDVANIAAFLMGMASKGSENNG